ncbi:TraC family protein [Enterovibrio norvegicus]|uniref:TraC family protein n=1 Tax=Enterovibrio norvegicus TaxID=188144 RepID=UPI00352EEF0D
MSALKKFMKEMGDQNYGQHLPVIGYQRKDRYFQLDDGYIGVMFKLHTLPAVNDEIQEQFETIYKFDWPEHSFVQTIFWASDDISPQINRLKTLHGGRQVGQPNDQLDAVSENLCQFYYDAAANGFAGTECKPRSFEVYLAFKIPIKRFKPTEKELATLFALRRDVSESCSKIGMAPIEMDEWSWWMMMNRLHNRGNDAKWRTGMYTPDPSRLVREQVQDIGGKIEFHKDCIQIDDQYIASLSPKLYPKAMTFGDMLNIYNDWKFGSNSFWGNFMMVLNVHMPNDKATKKLLKSKRAWMNMQSNNRFTQSIDKVRWQKKDYDEAFSKMEGKKSRLVDAYLQVLVFADSREDMEEKVSKFRRIAASPAQFELEQDKHICGPLFLQSLPFGPEKESIKHLHRYLLLPSDCAGFLTPFLSSSVGNTTLKPIVPFVTRAMGMFGFNPFETNGSMNGMVVAESGSGKSVLIQYIVNCILGSGPDQSNYTFQKEQLRKELEGKNPRDYTSEEKEKLKKQLESAIRDGGMAFIIDVGRSYERLCEVLGGQFICFGGDMPFSLNPFPSVIDWNGSKDPQSGMILEMVKVMAEPNGTLGTYESRKMSTILGKMWEQHKQKSTITIFAQMCKEDPDKRMQDIGEQLQPYCEGGMFGSMFTDTKPPPSLDNPFIVCELEELKSQPEVSIIALMQIINLCYQHFFMSDSGSAKKRRKVFIVDECWSFLSGSENVGQQVNPVAKFLEAAFRRFRKVNASAWIVTQMLSDIYGSDVGKSIAANCVYRCYLYQKRDTIEQVKKDRLMDLSDQQFELLKSIRTRKNLYAEIFIQAGDDVTEIVRFYAPPSMLLLFSTDPKDKEDMQRYVDQGYGVNDAIDAILKERGITARDLNTGMVDLDNDDDEDDMEAA